MAVDSLIFLLLPEIVLTAATNMSAKRRAQRTSDFESRGASSGCHPLCLFTRTTRPARTSDTTSFVSTLHLLPFRRYIVTYFVSFKGCKGDHASIGWRDATQRSVAGLLRFWAVKKSHKK